MQGILEFMSGKKSYLVSAITLVLAGVELFTPYKIPDEVYLILAGAFGVSIRAAVTKLKEEEFTEKSEKSHHKIK